MVVEVPLLTAGGGAETYWGGELGDAFELLAE